MALVRAASRVPAPPSALPRRRGIHTAWVGLLTGLLLLGSPAAAQTTPAAPAAKPSALNNGSAAEASAYYKKLAGKLKFLTPETIESKANMQELLNYLGYPELTAEVVEFEEPGKLMLPASKGNAPPSSGSTQPTVLAAGSTISLQSDLGMWLTRCKGCVPTVNNVDATAAQSNKDPASAPEARFVVVDAGNGKVALKADSGMYLARCRSCVRGSAKPDTLTVHVSGSAPPPPFAQFTPERLPNGRFALKSDLGRYVARCNGCVRGASVENTVTIHATNPRVERFAQWTVLQHPSGPATASSSKEGDILVSRFFAPKIVNFSVPPEQRNIGWRRLVRINSRPNSEARKHHVESAWILFNHFTTPPNHSPFGGTPSTEQLKDSPWGKVKVTVPGNMKNGSVNTQVALVTQCTASKEECAEVDSIYWVDFGPSDKGYKLSYQLDAFFDAGNLVAAGDHAGAAPYFVPNGCDTCHGSLRGQAILNLLDTDHWMDRVTDGDFPALGKPEAPAPLFDAGKDTTTPQYAAAFDIIRTLNEEISDMQKRVNARSFQLASTKKWLELHQSSVKPEPSLVARGFDFANIGHPLHKTRKPEPSPLVWKPVPEDQELLGLLNTYCYRCHGAIRFDVFSKDMVADQTSPMLDRIDPNPTQAKVIGFKMPPDRDIPEKDKQRLLDLLDALDLKTHK